MSDRRTSRAQGPGLRAASSGTSNPRLVGLSRAGYRALEKRRLDEAQRWFDQVLLGRGAQHVRPRRARGGRAQAE